MNSTFDEFSRSFDSIPVDKAKPMALPEAPLAFGEATGEFDDVNGPGYTLLDDAGGRFVIERDTGVISLVHGDLLATDAGLVFPVKFRCVEFSGISYDMELRLKINGRVPQIVGDDGDFGLTSMAQGSLFDDAVPLSVEAPAAWAPTPAPLVEEPIAASEPELVAAPMVAPVVEPEPLVAAASEPMRRRIMVAAWDGFAAFRGHAARRPLRKQGPFGALVVGSLPPVNVEAGALSLDEKLPPPAPMTMSWTL
jgi:hypothetical protein